jgi:hypothetical protein
MFRAGKRQSEEPGRASQGCHSRRYTIMLAFYLPFIIFGAMFEAISNQNVSVPIQKPPSFG